jgi:hypothetical protein
MFSICSMRAATIRQHAEAFAASGEPQAWTAGGVGLAIRKEKKGGKLLASVSKPATPTADLLAQHIPEILRRFPGRNRCAGAAPATSSGCGR